MWPFTRKPPPPPAPPPVFYRTTSLQVGDECVCIVDDPHRTTHQKLLTCGEIYTVRGVYLARGKESPAPNGYGGPWIRVVGVLPIDDQGWACSRFEKVAKAAPAKESIVEAVSKPAGLNVEKEREEAY